MLVLSSVSFYDSSFSNVSLPVSESLTGFMSIPVYSDSDVVFESEGVPSEVLLDV